MLAKSAIVGMESLLGPGPANSLLFHSRILYNLSDPAAVHHRLRSLLGNGSKVVEESIVSQIYRDLGLPAPKGEFDFAACISLAATIHRTREVDLV